MSDPTGTLYIKGDCHGTVGTWAGSLLGYPDRSHELGDDTESQDVRRHEGIQAELRADFCSRTDRLDGRGSAGVILQRLAAQLSRVGHADGLDHPCAREPPSVPARLQQEVHRIRTVGFDHLPGPDRHDCTGILFGRRRHRSCARRISLSSPSRRLYEAAAVTLSPGLLDRFDAYCARNHTV